MIESEQREGGGICQFSRRLSTSKEDANLEGRTKVKLLCALGTSWSHGLWKYVLVLYKVCRSVKNNYLFFCFFCFFKYCELWCDLFAMVFASTVWFCGFEIHHKLGWPLNEQIISKEKKIGEKKNGFFCDFGIICKVLLVFSGVRTIFHQYFTCRLMILSR